MLRNLTESRQIEQTKDAAESGADRRLQVILWALWTVAVAVTAFIRWRADMIAQRPIDVLGIVIYSVLTGTIGLVVLTMLEMWLEPQRFVD